ncbi:hypothetical protein JS531_00360 [Bifidobacterium sp. CP2]|uniref:hypothetical protein n=1 Tax=Bifidobacterium sp. CP2 TaxID=2809025 RepID=UPI001BDD3458|nr:hypothetical protein [Bifidobacterium sp. CP2]MBT1180456.1 hypothetical protein [Bifidobacterium sp. CP2]
MDTTRHRTRVMRRLTLSPTPQEFGSMPEPMFGQTACRCHTVVADGRERISRLASSTALVTGAVRETLAGCRGITWDGPAATYFRGSVNTLAALMDEHDDDALAAARIA